MAKKGNRTTISLSKDILSILEKIPPKSRTAYIELAITYFSKSREGKILMKEMEKGKTLHEAILSLVLAIEQEDTQNENLGKKTITEDTEENKKQDDDTGFDPTSIFS